MRVLLGGLLVGVALLLACGSEETVQPFDAEALGRDGGVLHVRMEVFVRADPARTGSGEEPEHFVYEEWVLMGAGWSSEDIVSIARAVDGTPLWLARGNWMDQENRVAGRELGERIDDGSIVTEMPRSFTGPIEERFVDDAAGGRFQQASDAADKVQTYVERDPATGAVARGSVGDLFHGDLAASEIEWSWMFTPGFTPLGVEVWAVVDDGERVLIGSTSITYSALPLSEWETIEELAFGE